MDVYGYIYLVRNRVNGKVYVGQTTQRITTRWVEHKSQATLRKTSIRFHNAIRKYGFDVFDVVELHRAFSREELDDMERRAIETHEATDQTYGYNMKTGGARGELTEDALEKMRRASTGKCPSPASRAKMSAAHTARWTPEMREKARETSFGEKNPFFGRTHSVESRRRISERAQGRKLSDAQRQVISARSRERWNDPVFRAKQMAQRAGAAHREKHILGIANARAKKKLEHQPDSSLLQR